MKLCTRKSTIQLMNIFSQTGAMLTGGHFVYTSGKHGEVYVNKDAVYPHPQIHTLCEALVMDLPYDVIQFCEIVAAPALGGIVLSRLVADYLRKNCDIECLAVYAEKITDGQFEFRRGYNKLIAGRGVLIVEDIMTTGISVAKVRAAAEKAGAQIRGAAALWNRGGKTAEDIQVPHLTSLISHQFPSWDEADCPLCKSGVPVNQEVGKGKEFLIRKAQEDVVKAANRAIAEVLGGKKK